MKNVADIYALAPLQQLMLMHALGGGDSTALVEQFHCTLKGRLDAARPASAPGRPSWLGIRCCEPASPGKA